MIVFVLDKTVSRTNIYLTFKHKILYVKSQQDEKNKRYI